MIMMIFMNFVTIAITLCPCRNLIKNRVFNNCTTLKAFLVRNYTDKRPYTYWQNELSNCQQKFNEDVRTYSQKIENYYCKLIQIAEEIDDKIEKEHFIKWQRKLAIESFISRLKSDLSLIIFVISEDLISNPK